MINIDLKSFTEYFFKSPIYAFQKENFLNKINKVSDKYILEAKNNNKILIDREKTWGKKISKQKKDHGLVYHSKSLINETEFLEFNNFVIDISKNILDIQGFDLTNYTLYFTELWVQEFSKTGGGNHNTHIHSDNHISGFYFLKCSDKTSFPIFHDPRPGAVMTKLPQKNTQNITIVSDMINYKPTPGTFVFFNSYLPHEFPVDNGIDNFRFVHFNIQAIKNEILNKDLTKSK